MAEHPEQDLSQDQDISQVQQDPPEENKSFVASDVSGTLAGKLEALSEKLSRHRHRVYDDTLEINIDAIKQTGAQIFAVDTGSNDTYVISLSPDPGLYTIGMVVHFDANTANTGAATLNINSLGAKTIKKLHDQDLATNDIEAGQFVTVIYDGTNFQMQSQIAASAAAITDIQIFTSSGTWTKPTGAITVDVYVIGGGGGGGGGKRQSAASGHGGGGGAGGGYSSKRFGASILGASETVTVGTGGAGGAGAASGSGDADGTNGTVGNASSFGTTVLLKAPGGDFGDGGTGSGGPGGTGTQGNGEITQAGGDGGTGEATGTAPPDTATLLSPRGGGGGGNEDNSGLGVTGGAFITNFVRSGGAGGTDENNGANGTAVNDNLFHGGVGAGGGGHHFDGGTGGTPGGGAGGGAGSGDTLAAGDGGTGGRGVVVVVTYF